MKKDTEQRPVRSNRQPAVNGRRNTQADQMARGYDTETVTTSHAAENWHQMEKAAADIPVVDAQRVALIRKALLEGTYKVDPERIASNLIKFEKTLL